MVLAKCDCFGNKYSSQVQLLFLDLDLSQLLFFVRFFS